jgi:hypothetical protein
MKDFVKRRKKLKQGGEGADRLLISDGYESELS